MNCIIPFTKEVKFSTSIGEVTSISLEHEYNINDNILLGNFIVSGSYKTHELSVNSCDFSEVIPFDLSLPEVIDEKTFEFNIDNFTYELYSPNVLKVDISYLIKAKEIKVERLDIEFSDTSSAFDDIEIDSLDDSIFTSNTAYELEQALLSQDDIVEFEERIEEENILEEKVLEVIEDKPVDNNENLKTEIPVDIPLEIPELPEEDNSDRMIEETGTIMDFATKNEETFVTYKIHLMREGESVETVSKMYQLEETTLLLYNNTIKFNPGDKILIPEDE